jgi:two-component system, NarL family, invasion response regulator UvrY
MIKVALVDDHILLRDALASLIDNFENCHVICRVCNGKEMIDLLEVHEAPDVIIMDLNMPEMDGYQTAKWLHKHYPDILVLMLTMYDSEVMLVRLLQAGVKGFLKKDIHPSELQFAIQSVVTAGYYYSRRASDKLVNLFRSNKDNMPSLHNTLLNEKELEFLKLACSDLTYKEIAQQMGLNPRAVDNLRDSLFEKIDVKSRIGLAMYAIRNALVTF